VQEALVLAPDGVEQRFLLEGLLRGWIRVRYSRLLDEYEFAHIEQELRWDVGWTLDVNVIDLLRCDALLRRRSDGKWFYLEFKSAAACNDGWISSWETNAQILMNIRAIERTLGIRIEGIIIEGLEKGTRVVETNPLSAACGQMIQNSPFCYIWQRPDSSGAMVLRAYGATGWTRTPWWDLKQSARDVVEWLSLNGELESRFASVPPIRPREELLERYHQELLWQEASIAHKRLAVIEDPEMLARYFPHNPDHCLRYRNYPCDMYDICYNGQVAEDPIASGLYERRVPNHPEDGDVNTIVQASEDR